MKDDTKLKLLEELAKLAEEPKKIESTYMKIGNFMVYGTAIILAILYATTKEINFIYGAAVGLFSGIGVMYKTLGTQSPVTSKCMSIEQINEQIEEIKKRNS